MAIKTYKDGVGKHGVSVELNADFVGLQSYKLNLATGFLVAAVWKAPRSLPHNETVMASVSLNPVIPQQGFGGEPTRPGKTTLASLDLDFLRSVTERRTKGGFSVFSTR